MAVDLSNLPHVSDYHNPDDYVRAVIFPKNSGRKVGKLAKIRRLSASLGMSIDKKDFYKMVESGEIRECGKYRYTAHGKSSYSLCYNVYDYFKIKNNRGA